MTHHGKDDVLALLASGTGIRATRCGMQEAPLRRDAAETIVAKKKSLGFRSLGLTVLLPILPPIAAVVAVVVPTTSRRPPAARAATPPLASVTVRHLADRTATGFRQSSSREKIVSRRATTDPDPPLPLSDNWSTKAIGRRTTGTGRMRYLKTLPRRFKNGFREGAYSDTDGVQAARGALRLYVRVALSSAARGAANARRGRAGLRDQPAHPPSSPMSFDPIGIVARVGGRAHYLRRGWFGEGSGRGRPFCVARRATDPSPVASRPLARRVQPLARRVPTTRRPSRPIPRSPRPDPSLAATRPSPPAAPRTLGADLSSPMYDPSSLQARRPSPRSAPPPIKRDLRRALAMGSPRDQLLMGS